MKSKIAVSIFALLLLGPNIGAYAQEDLEEARAMEPGATVTVSGTVTNGEELGTIRFIQDETAGLAIYDLDATTFNRGDHVTVTGILDEFNQLLEVIDLTSWSVHSTGNLLPGPKLVTVDEFNEMVEGQFIRVNQVIFANAGSTFTGNTNYDVTSGDVTGQVRISPGSNLVGQTIPTGPVDLAGIMGQYHLSDPDLGYQLMLRDQDDIIPGEQIAVTSSLELSNLTTSGFDLSWTTNVSGTSQLFFGNTPDLELGLLTGPGGGTVHTVAVTGAQPSTLFYVKGFSVKDADTAFTGIQVFITASISNGEIITYFTSTVDLSVSSGIDAVQIDNAVDDTLISYIDRAKESIDAAIYNFGVDGISDIAAALNQAYNRGVRVRILFNGSTANQGIGNLDASIPRLASPTGGMETGIMHNKFVVFDAYTADANEALVWTGSTNWTNNNINTDANNVIIIRDKSLAIGYTLEFNEMWGGSGETPNAGLAKFGASKVDNTPHEYLVSGIPVYSYFSPSDGVNLRIIEAINTGDVGIAVNTMLITRSDIGYALEDRVRLGMSAKVIVNDEGDCTETVVNTLKTAIGPYFRAYNEDGLLHSKCMIVDMPDIGSDPLVLVGSHNWSNSADTKNDENTLIIHDATLANIFYQEFSQRFRLGTPLAVPGSVREPDELSLWPNPANGLFRISSGWLADQSSMVRIYTLDGRRICQQSADKPGESTMIVSTTQIPAGMYVVEISNGDQLLREKVIVAR